LLTSSQSVLLGTMSETIREGHDLCSVPGMTEAILELTEKYGLEATEAEQGVQLGRAMYGLLIDYEAPGKQATGRRAVEKTVKNLFSSAAESVPNLLLDKLGCPLPRYRYVASDILGLITEEGDPFHTYFTQVRNAPITPNFANTKNVIDVIVPLLQNHDFPYNQRRFVLPEDPEHMPRTPFKDDKEEANFFLTACLWMRRTDSNKAMRDLGKAFDDTRSMERDPFAPEIVAAMTPEEVAGIFGNYPQLRMLASNAPGLIHNMRYIISRFDGDIRNAYTGTEDFDEIVLRLKNDPHQENPALVQPEFGNGLYGFAEKMVSMLTYYLMETKKIAPIDYPPPIDQHFAKLTAGTNSVTIHEDFRDENYMTECLQGIARNLYYDLSIKHGIPVNDIAKAFWLLGSKNCSLSPATFTRVITRNGRASEFGEYEHDFDRNGFDTVSMYATCLSCPLHNAELCTSTSRGKENHLKGRLVLLDRASLPNPADHALFGGDPAWEALTAATAALGRNRADQERTDVRRPQYEHSKRAAVNKETAEAADQDKLF